MKLWYGGISYLICCENTQKANNCWDARLIWNWQVVFASDKLCLYYEYVNIYTKVNSLLFEQFSCFLKNRAILKCFDFLFDLKKGSSWFYCKKGYIFSKYFLKRGQILQSRSKCVPIFPIQESPLGIYNWC